MAYKSQARFHPGQSVAIGVGGEIKDALDKFAVKVASRASRSATFAVADSIYREMKVNAAKGDHATGALKDAIYTYYNEKFSRQSFHVYSVGVNKRVAANWHWVEYGRWRHYQTVKIDGKWVTLKDRPLDSPVWVPPTPYLRPAYDAMIVSAFDVFKRRFSEALKES